MDRNHIRILHEYEIMDRAKLHFANVVYLREYSEENSENKDLMDVVDKIMENCINKGCNVIRKHPPRVVALDNEVEDINRRLLEEFQLKGYFTFYAPSETKGGISTDFSRITIHVSVLVKDEADVRFFENIGNQENVSDARLVGNFALRHYVNPVYLLQEHPLAHGIVCYKDVQNSEVLYFLYRHNANLTESILAEVDCANLIVRLKLGSDNEQSVEVLGFAESVKAKNNLSPLYQCTYSTELAPRYFTRLWLNKEREIFTKAKDLLLDELGKNQYNVSYENMIKCLSQMIEA